MFFWGLNEPYEQYKLQLRAGKSNLKPIYGFQTLINIINYFNVSSPLPKHNPPTTNFEEAFIGLYQRKALNFNFFI